MPPTGAASSTTSTTTTFAKQQTDIDEISAALPALASRHAALLARRRELTARLSSPSTGTSSPTTTSSPDTTSTIADELAEVDAETDAVALQQRGRLMMARECEKANRRMLEVVSVEFLTRGEREVLGGLRVKLARILEEFG